MEEPSSLVISLVAEPVSLRDIIRSFSLKYEHNGPKAWSGHELRDIVQRDDHTEDKLIYAGFNPQLDARMPLFPPSAAPGENISSSLIR